MTSVHLGSMDLAGWNDMPTTDPYSSLAPDQASTSGDSTDYSGDTAQSPPSTPISPTYSAIHAKKMLPALNTASNAGDWFKAILNLHGDNSTFCRSDTGEPQTLDDGFSLHCGTPRWVQVGDTHIQAPSAWMGLSLRPSALPGDLKLSDMDGLSIIQLPEVVTNQDLVDFATEHGGWLMEQPMDHYDGAMIERKMTLPTHFLVRQGMDGPVRSMQLSLETGTDNRPLRIYSPPSQERSKL